MSANTIYKLTGNGVSVTYETSPASVELTLDDSYRPFDGTNQVTGGDLTEQFGAKGLQLTGTLHGEIAGRGGPIEQTLHFTLFLPLVPAPSDSAEEADATGAAVFADPDSRGGVSPAYRAEALTGTVSSPPAGPGGRF
jgi:hypothetical protein